MSTSTTFTDRLTALASEVALETREQELLATVCARSSAWPTELPDSYVRNVTELVTAEFRNLAASTTSQRRATHAWASWFRSRWLIVAAVLSAASGGVAFSGALAHALHRVESIVLAPTPSTHQGTLNGSQPAIGSSAGIPPSGLREQGGQQSSGSATATATPAQSRDTGDEHHPLGTVRSIPSSSPPVESPTPNDQAPPSDISQQAGDASSSPAPSDHTDSSSSPSDQSTSTTGSSNQSNTTSTSQDQSSSATGSSDQSNTTSTSQDQSSAATSSASSSNPDN
ncbi:hypothetical protein Afer_1506 [Acidimicrobium ferrooxidans DSM 10331]|uniref:Uncharacterized protein n=1 Tax=Acidimicrobium ferrooxidans (strain DSM 10331 / JCM 15462 / NBRC 103882 / ICP) TaxID=525909 RepID=C7M0C1_ACIFD|nr:hypothetical protein Afer_1506 [Acidimicrobium ferrooxidans DSM 10331]